MTEPTPPPLPPQSPQPPPSSASPMTPMMNSMASTFVRDPVRVSWVIYTFIQAVVAVLLLAGVLNEVAGGIIVGITAAAYAAISELFVRPDTVPRVPLEELARAQAPPR